MASIPNGAFLAPHSCHNALRKEMEIKRLERLSSASGATGTPESTPPGSPRKIDPPSPYSSFASVWKYLWPSSFNQQSQFSGRPPEGFQGTKQGTPSMPRGIPTQSEQAQTDRTNPPLE